MARRGIPVAEYWCRVYRQLHGASYRFKRSDGVILAEILKDYGSEETKWMIREYHRGEDPFADRNGWDMRAFKMRVRKLHLDFVRKFEREGRRDQQELTRQLSLLEQDPRVADAVARVGRDR